MTAPSVREALKICRDFIRGEMIEASVVDVGTMQSLGEMIDAALNATPPAPTPSGARALPANRIWLDTEFIEDGTTIDLISIGMVRSDGATYYAETDQWIPGKASQWVKDNVIVHLKGGDCIKPRDVIAREIVEFAGERPEFWAYYADYDWVALCQLFGTMMQLPDGWPKFCRDIKQRAVDLGNPKLPEQTSTEHHALADALWNKEAWDFLALLPDAAAIRAAAFEPTEAQINSACLSFRHDYGLLDDHDRERLRFVAVEWLRAWQKEGFGCDRDEVIERCAAVVDQCNREGPYEAIASAKRIRALKSAAIRAAGEK
jgi:hypothetical protein